MTRSLSSSFLGVLVLALVVLQGVLAYIEPGRYLILTEDNRFLSVGPVPHVYPPLDVPARIFDNRFLNEAWEVRQAEGGYIIRQTGDRQDTYGLISRNDDVFVSVLSKPRTWVVNRADRDLYTIGVTDQDLLFTQSPDDSLRVLLAPASGSRGQRWRFIPIERDSDAFGRLYGKSRFNVQCAM
ncbi:hypothetical protein BGZ95_010341 [Linnemannia exigua]|uniref:Ricin B lectin domain-containing protein n=1 Tax=Linnemannia exigua TaxID=604196 RepID=A0AAD4DBH7_9FUNG|nr:hypothetical protein BGZ95_010341 [Linnemannia exigua]